MTFRKGESGNPRGRPRGIQTQAKLREAIAADLPDIIKAMSTAAKAGDVGAARLLMDRSLAALKPTDSPAPLLPAVGPTDLAGAATAVLSALTTGEATPDQAASLASVLASLARVKEVAELEARITALEERRNAEVAPQSP